MEYASLLAGLAYTGTPPKGEATAVAQDSRRVVEGSVYVCIAGKSYDGHDYAAAALEAGAGMVVSQRPLGLPREVTVPDTRAANAVLCANFFGRPADKLSLIGVTGTNGKSTVSSVLKQVLQSQGINTGLIGTIRCEVGDMEVPAKFTTPEPWDLNALLDRMVRAGCTHAVLEASSQALAQKRLYGLRFALGIFTNLTQDHLDVHGDMEGYYQAKKLLFAQCGALLANADDAWGRRLLGECGVPVKRGFSTTSDSADFTARSIDLRADGVRFGFLGEGFLHPVVYSTPGGYSVANALAAAGAAVMLGCGPAAVARALGGVKPVRGRCEVLHSGAFTVICDFAHTPDAIEKLLESLKPFVRGRMVVVFGCAGVRDSTKRPLMSKAVLAYADAVYLTADNPRAEPAEQTMAGALPPLAESGKLRGAEPDRECAVEQALDSLEAGDMLVLCGKGHEDYQVMDGYTVYLDEARIVRRWLDKEPRMAENG